MYNLILQYFLFFFLFKFYYTFNKNTVYLFIWHQTCIFLSQFFLYFLCFKPFAGDDSHRPEPHDPNEPNHKFCRNINKRKNCTFQLFKLFHLLKLHKTGYFCFGGRFISYVTRKLRTQIWLNFVNQIFCVKIKIKFVISKTFKCFRSHRL